MTAATTSRDPLDFDFGLGFASSADRIRGEREERLAYAERQLPFHHALLDDCLRSIMPHDLIVIGAYSGLGKTELGRHIAASTAAAGRNAYVFALEAEQRELERRTKYGVLAGLVYQRRLDLGRQFNFSDWYRGVFDAQLVGIEQEADRIVADRFKTLFTYYRGPEFYAANFKKLVLAYQTSADLFVLDHLHYVDNDDDNENRGMREIVQTVRNAALLVGKPVILIVHLRKRTQGSKALVPNLDDIHGSSEIAKNCTHAIMLDRAHGVVNPNKNLSNTFFSIPKDRGDGTKHLIALCPFDWRRKTYADYYTLGRDNRGSFEPLGTDEVPYWASRHEPMSAPPAGFGDAS